MHSASKNATSVVPTVSAIRLRRNTEVLHPKILRAFRLRTRVGISAIAKLTELMAEIQRIRMAAAISYKVFARLPISWESLMQSVA